LFHGDDWVASYPCVEYKTGSLTAFGPFGVLGTITLSSSPIGQLWSSISQAMVLTATAGTPAAGSPATITVAKAFLAPNFNPRLLFGPTLRKVPVRQVCLPQIVSSNLVHFTLTSGARGRARPHPPP